MAALIIASVVQLEIACVAVAAYANADGVPFGSVRAALDSYDETMLPLIEAALTFDPAQMTKGLADAIPKSERIASVLDEGLQHIGKNAKTSARVIGVANVLLIALSIYQVASVPAVGGGGAPSVMPVSGGAAIAAQVGSSAGELAVLVESVQKLVAIGALQPAVIAGLTQWGGGAGVSPQLRKPSILAMEGSGGGQAASSKSGSGGMQGDGDNTGRTEPLNNRQARQMASDLKFSETREAPFNRHGQLAFKKGNRYISPDVDVHSGGTWKVFDAKGNRLGTYNADLSVRIGD